MWTVADYNSRASIATRNLSVDGALFYFRNERQGTGPCLPSAGCPLDCSGQWPGAAGCLSGSCAEPTVANLPGEISDVAASLPVNTSVFVGLYVTGAIQPSSLPGWDCSTPSTEYARKALEVSLAQPPVQGVVVFAMAHQGGLKRDIVAGVFSSFDSRCPSDTPFVYTPLYDEKPIISSTACCHTTAFLARAGSGGGWQGRCDGNRACCLGPPGSCIDLPSCAAHCPADRPFGYTVNATDLCCAVDIGIRPTGARASSKCPTGKSCCLGGSACGEQPSCSPPPPPPPPVAQCPKSKPYQYGSAAVGVFCCGEKPGDHGSTCPSGACCLVPSSVGSCQQEPNCNGTNHGTRSLGTLASKSDDKLMQLSARARMKFGLTEGGGASPSFSSVLKSDDDNLPNRRAKSSRRVNWYGTYHAQTNPRSINSE